MPWCCLQTIRRILHLRAGELLGLERPLELKLRVLPLDFAALDVVVPGRAVQLPDAKLDQSYQAQVSQPRGGGEASQRPGPS